MKSGSAGGGNEKEQNKARCDKKQNPVIMFDSCRNLLYYTNITSQIAIVSKEKAMQRKGE